MGEYTLLPMHIVLLGRLARSVCLGLLLILMALLIGMCGYHFLESMTWVDAFLNASMILSGMGPVQTLQTTSGKMFAGFYALFSGLFFIAIVGVIAAPVLQHFLRRIHLEAAAKAKKH
jgi:hypothetical protein